MKVAVLFPKIFNYPFTYEAKISQKLTIGDFVKAPFGSSEITGVVWPHVQKTEKKFKIKKISKKIDIKGLNLSMINFIDSLPPGISSLDKMLALEQRFFLGDHNLIYTDKMSMATGVEVRVPLLDEDLMEFVYSIPDKFKQNGRAGKWIFKKTMEKYLPKNIIYRPKTGFGVPLKKWLNEELKDLLDDLLSKESICKRDIFEYKNVEELIKKNNSGELNASYTIFSLMIIEIWFRIFVDKNSLESF